MSISNLLVPNDLDLFCNSLTAKTYNRIDLNSNLAVVQSVLNGTITAVNFPNAFVSNNFAAPAGNNTYTIPASGFYSISYSVQLTNTTGVGRFKAWIKRSSANFVYAQSSVNLFEAAALTVGPPVSGITLGTDNISLSGSSHVSLFAGETFQIQVYQTSGVTQQLVSSSLGSINEGPIIVVDYIHS